MKSYRVQCRLATKSQDVEAAVTRCVDEQGERHFCVCGRLRKETEVLLFVGLSSANIQCHVFDLQPILYEYRLSLQFDVIKYN